MYALQDYLAAMACAANYAWVNRSMMTFLVRQAFAKQFNTTPDALDMHLVYDVSHNIAKVCPHSLELQSYTAWVSSVVEAPVATSQALYLRTLRRASGMVHRRRITSPGP